MPTYIFTQMLDRVVINTTLYAMGLFCLMFNTRLFAPDTYQLMCDAIIDAPHMVGQFIPTTFIETHGFSYPQIIGIAWDHMCHMQTGLRVNLSPEEIVALMHAPLPDAFIDEEVHNVDMLALLVTAARS